MIILYISSFFAGIVLCDFALEGEILRLFACLLLLVLLLDKLIGFSRRVFVVFLFGIVSALLRIYLGFVLDFADFSFELSFLESLREGVLLKLNGFFPPTENAFLAGLLVGERSSLSPEVVVAFNRTGLTHILAISGYNVSIIVAFALRMLSFLPQKLKMGFAVFFVVFFVLFVGPSAPVVRAGIMGIIALLAVIFNREYLAFNALFVSAFLMAMFNPEILYGSISFQLSFLATLGILMFGRKFESFFGFLPEKLFIRQSVTMTMSAQVLVLPIILLNFGNMSLVAPLANVLVLPFIPLVMLGGFVVIFLSFLFQPLAYIFSVLVHFLLFTMLLEIGFLADLPFAAIGLDWFNFWFALSYYFFILWFWWKDSSLGKISI